MRARARHSAWDAEFTAVEPLPWLTAIGRDWDLIATDEGSWTASNATALCAAAVDAATGPYRGPSVATKVLKQPYALASVPSDRRCLTWRRRAIVKGTSASASTGNGEETSVSGRRRSDPRDR